MEHQEIEALMQRLYNLYGLKRIQKSNSHTHFENVQQAKMTNLK